MSVLLSLYPKRWRERYGDEFRWLLAEQPPSLGDRVDIVRGAVDAHLNPQIPGPERIPDHYGFAPLVGLASLIVAVFLAADGPVLHDEYGSYRDGAAALPFLVLALVLLSVGLYRVVGCLPTAAGGPRGAGLTAIWAGPVWALMPWILLLGLVFLLGTLGLAVGARRAGIWPTWSVVLVVVALAVPAALLAAMPFLPWYALRESGFAIIIGSISVLWLLIGGLLLRGSPRRVPA